MDFEQVRKYWDERAAADSSAQSTTQDFYLREIEFRVLKELVERFRPARIMDAGCGDARTTAMLAAQFKAIQFTGGDYSEAMVRNAQDNIGRAGIDNLQVMLCDVSKTLPVGQQDMVYSTRCLINLPTWELQKTALINIADAIVPGGCYVMIENFIEGHDNFNRVRRDFDLPEIALREHNLFFHRPALIEFARNYYEILEEVNISSSYYLGSRIVYSKICQEQGKVPDYFDAHHKYAAQLPFCGEFGPIRMICMRKK
jgi:trans-aconitate methyltransferase